MMLVCVSSLQAGVNRQVGINGVDMDGKFKMNSVSNDISVQHYKML